MLMEECGWRGHECSLHNSFNLAAGLEVFIIECQGVVRGNYSRQCTMLIQNRLLTSKVPEAGE